jgi:hypothetical protein
LQALSNHTGEIIKQIADARPVFILDIGFSQQLLILYLGSQTIFENKRENELPDS